eukprot:72308_1
MGKMHYLPRLLLFALALVQIHCSIVIQDDTGVLVGCQGCVGGTILKGRHTDVQYFIRYIKACPELTASTCKDEASSEHRGYDYNGNPIVQFQATYTKAFLALCYEKKLHIILEKFAGLSEDGNHVPMEERVQFPIEDIKLIIRNGVSGGIVASLEPHHFESNMFQLTRSGSVTDITTLQISAEEVLIDGDWTVPGDRVRIVDIQEIGHNAYNSGGYNGQFPNFNGQATGFNNAHQTNPYNGLPNLPSYNQNNGQFPLPPNFTYQRPMLNQARNFSLLPNLQYRPQGVQQFTQGLPNTLQQHSVKKPQFVRTNSMFESKDSRFRKSRTKKSKSAATSSPSKSKNVPRPRNFSKKHMFSKVDSQSTNEPTRYRCSYRTIHPPFHLMYSFKKGFPKIRILNDETEENGIHMFWQHGVWMTRAKELSKIGINYAIEVSKHLECILSPKFIAFSRATSLYSGFIVTIVPNVKSEDLKDKNVLQAEIPPGSNPTFYLKDSDQRVTNCGSINVDQRTMSLIFNKSEYMWNVYCKGGRSIHPRTLYLKKAIKEVEHKNDNEDDITTNKNVNLSPSPGINPKISYNEKREDSPLFSIRPNPSQNTNTNGNSNGSNHKQRRKLERTAIKKQVLQINKEFCDLMKLLDTNTNLETILNVADGLKNKINRLSGTGVDAYVSSWKNKIGRFIVLAKRPQLGSKSDSSAFDDMSTSSSSVTTAKKSERKSISGKNKFSRVTSSAFVHRANTMIAKGNSDNIDGKDDGESNAKRRKLRNTQSQHTSTVTDVKKATHKPVTVNRKSSVVKKATFLENTSKMMKGQSDNIDGKDDGMSKPKRRKRQKKQRNTKSEDTSSVTDVKKPAHGSVNINSNSFVVKKSKANKKRNKGNKKQQKKSQRHY